MCRRTLEPNGARTGERRLSGQMRSRVRRTSDVQKADGGHRGAGSGKHGNAGSRGDRGPPAQLRTDGLTIVADVVDTQLVRSTRRGTVTNTRYEVQYRFQPPKGSIVASGWEEVPEEVARLAAQTKTIEVRYLPNDPSVNLPSASVG